MKKYYIILNVLLLGALGSFAQTTGDYRSTGDANWGTLSTWERWSGSAWVTPTAGQGYPGQLSVPAVVTILNTDDVTLNVSPANHIGSLILQTGTSTSSVTFTATNALIVDGDVTFEVSTDNTSGKDITVGAGSLTCASVTMNNPAAGNDPSTLSISTGSVTVTGDVTMLGSNTENFITFSNNGSLNVGGTITGGALTPSTGVVNYNGASQNIGNYTYYRLTTSGTGTKTLTASITVTNVLTLTSGILTIPTGMQLLVSNGNVIGGAPFSSTKHIATQVNTGTGAQGFLRVNNMAQSVAYLLPVGDGTNYLPATLTPSSPTAGNRTFSVCAFPGITTNGTPNGTAFTAVQKARCVDAVWTITYNGAGAPTAAATTVATAWPATLEGSNFALVSGALIGVAHYDGPSWGTAAGVGDNGANTATRTNVTTFSPFAVGIISPSGAPLPIKVYYFNAAKGNAVNTLNWNAECSSTAATFEIERSADGVNFTTINTITASQARCALPFTYDDNSGVVGTVFYRIKIIDADGGRVSFTSKVKVGGKQNDIQLAGILPNPVSSIAQLNVTTTKKDKVELAIISLEGKVMYRNAVQLQSGSSIVSLDVSGLASGTYFVRGVFADGQTNSIKFIKQ